jgi:hypothetical protein
MSEHRQKNFAVNINTTRHGEPGEIDLSITHNGRQWYTWSLTPIERLKVLRALFLYDDGEREAKST